MNLLTTKKKSIFTSIFLILFSTNVFSIPLKYESFDIENLINFPLIIKFEYNYYQNGEFRMQKIEDIEIAFFTYSENMEEIINPNNSTNMINYSPVSDMSLNKLNKISPSKKIKTLFKSFSVQTIDGRYIINSLDDIHDDIIVIKGDRYSIIINEELLFTKLSKCKEAE